MKLIPTNVGWELNSIVEIFNDTANKFNLDFHLNSLADLPINVAQEFVDAEYDLHEQDYHEEDFIIERNDRICRIIIYRLQNR